jgi:formiminotetrahydrofolate cyclodeaminase
VPGGGGASALAGAMGAALGGMVCNYTLGKKKYAAYEKDIERIIARAGELRRDFEALMDKDAEAFEPLSRAYGLPKDTVQQAEERARVMERELRRASAVPFEMMEKTLETITLHEELAAEGSRLMISDVGVGALMCAAALRGAALNVFINTRMMKDREFASELDAKTSALLEDGEKRARAVYEKVEAELR